MKKTLLLSTLLFAGASIAQTAPSIGLTDLKPTDGETFTFKKTAFQTVTGSGANQTWDFSTLTAVGSPSTVTAHYAANSSTELYLEENGIRVFQNYLSDGIYETAVTIPNINGIQYTNTMKILPFPLNQDSQSEDSYTTSQTNNGQTSSNIGVYKVKYHGHGTLITPAGTFNNVICVEIDQSYASTLNGSSVGNGFATGYAFYKPGVHHYLFTMMTSGGNTSASQSGMYLDVSPLEIEKMNKISFIVAPNPATDGFSISGDNLVKTVQLFDLNGKEIPVSYDATTNFVNISDVTPGVYHLQVLTDAGLATQKVVKR